MKTSLKYNLFGGYFGNRGRGDGVKMMVTDELMCTFSDGRGKSRSNGFLYTISHS